MLKFAFYRAPGSLTDRAIRLASREHNSASMGATLNMTDEQIDGIFF